MKKILFTMLALVLVMGLVAPMAAPAVAHTEADPAVITLYAGQDIDVGTVSVWNDDTTLYVKYETTGDWVMTETHLAVAEELDDIPQTRKGNPIPGRFEYKMEHDPAVQAFTYAIPLGTWESCDIHDLVIAAHAKVVRPIDGCDEIVWQIGDVETNDCSGDLTNYANEFNWMKANGSGYIDPVGDCEMGPGLNDNEPAFTDTFIVGTTPVNEFPYNSNLVRGYATDFDVQWNGELLFGGLLNISWSPGSSATEKKVVSGDGISSKTLTAAGSSQSGQGWFMNKYPLVEHSITVGPLADGDHTINLQHTKGDGTFWDWITLEKPCEQWETAWAGTSVGEMPFAGKNWATYFTYTIQLPCPFPLVGNTKDISWGLRETCPIAYPNGAPVIFTGTVDASGLQNNGAVFIGLVDKDYIDDGYSGWMGGAYAYFGRIGNNLRVGPTDGNLGGEIIQVFKTYTDYFLAPTDVDFTMVIYDGSITITLEWVDYVDTYGEIKALNSKTAYAWDEFEYGAYIAVDTWPYDPYGVNDVSYDVLIDWCNE